MNRIFDRCGECTFFAKIASKDLIKLEKFGSWEGTCLNSTYRKSFHVNSDSDRCDRGRPKEPLNDIIPEKAPEGIL